MKSTGDLFSEICSMENLRKAHKNARKGKGWYKEVRAVDNDLEKHLKRLQTNLIEHRYHTSEYTVFQKIEGNKERDIYKLPYYPDRICQWAVLQVIEPYLIKTMTTDTYSAIPKRGAMPIIDDLRGHYHKIRDKGGRVIKKVWIPSVLVSDPEATKYCLKLDIRKYYPTTVHDVLMGMYEKLFKDADLLWLLDEVTRSISTCPATDENIDILTGLGYPVEIVTVGGVDYIDGVGIPIGNYLSQYGGNYNLSPLDHWLKEVKRVKYFYRYMDDMVILGNSKEKLHSLREDISEYLGEHLKQTLKDNWQVFPTKVRGIDFVGYRFFGEYTLLRTATCKRLKSKMLQISAKREKGITPTYSEWCSFNSYAGLLTHCDGFRLYKKYVEPNEAYMYQFYLKEVKTDGKTTKSTEYSTQRKAA